MRVQPLQRQSVDALHARDRLRGLGHRKAELRIGLAGGDLLVGRALHVGRHAHQHRLRGARVGRAGLPGVRGPSRGRLAGPWTLRHIVGLALIALGYAGWLTARLQIREFFTARAEARGLVTTGIYSKIRNPIYVFGLPLFAGVLLYLAQPWWWLLFLVPLILLQLWRARNEARVLDAKFGDAYRQYRSKTWF